MPEVHKGQRTVPVAGVHIFFCIQKQLLRGLFDKVPVMPRHGAAEFHVVFRPDDSRRAAGSHPLVKSTVAWLMTPAGRIRQSPSAQAECGF